MGRVQPESVNGQSRTPAPADRAHPNDTTPHRCPPNTSPRPLRMSSSRPPARRSQPTPPLSATDDAISEHVDQGETAKTVRWVATEPVSSELRQRSGAPACGNVTCDLRRSACDEVKLQMVRTRHSQSVLAGIGVCAALFVAPGQGAPGRTACGVTLPNGSHPPGTTASPNWYGNGKLFTLLWPHGVILVDPRFVNTDGSIWMKFPWWGVHVPPKLLRIGGQRLDGPSRPLRARVNSGAVPGFRGSFWASGVTFPQAGCWQVTGRVGRMRLTFVTLVRKVPG